MYIATEFKNNYHQILSMKHKYYKLIKQYVSRKIRQLILLTLLLILLWTFLNNFILYCGLIIDT